MLLTGIKGTAPSFHEQDKNTWLSQDIDPVAQT